MSAILDAVGDIFAAAIGWVGTVANTVAGSTEGVVNNPILLVFAILPLVGLGVGLFKRLLSVN